MSSYLDLTNNQAANNYTSLIHTVWTPKELATIPLEHIQPALIQLLKEGITQGQIDIWVKPHD